MSDVIEGTVADELPRHDESASTAVVRRERRSEVIRPLDSDALVDSFHAYQALLPKLLDASDYQKADGRQFIKKSGWRKIATAFDLDVQIIRSLVDRDDQGQPLRAEVWARAIAPSGRAMDGDGYCSVDEGRFQRRNGRQKLENDLRATATTRAMNRAISGLVGMGDVSAEEVTAGAIQEDVLAFGSVVEEPTKGFAAQALERIAGNRDTAKAAWLQCQQEFGYMPHAVARAFVIASAALPIPDDVPLADGADA